MSPILFRHFDGAVCGPAGTNGPVQNQDFSERTRCDSCILIALGTVAAFLASIVWAHSSLTQTFGNVPWSDIGLLVIGMPLMAAAAGWLLGGRAPSAVSRQPLE
jgi:hypothetical protein